jgi:chromosome segregation ATPase
MKCKHGYKSIVADEGFVRLVDILTNNIAKIHKAHQEQSETINENYRTIDGLNKKLSNLRSDLNKKNTGLEFLRNEQTRLKGEIGTKEKHLETMTNEIREPLKTSVRFLEAPRKKLLIC